jgi:hypothetical protein
LVDLSKSDAQLLFAEFVPIPPLWAPRLALPPPVSLMPRARLVELRLRDPLPARDVVAERVPDAEREPAPERLPGDPDVVSPAVSSMAEEPLSLLMLSVHSPIWSLRLLSCWLIWLRRDHRNRPAAAAPAAAAAAANGRSRTSSVTPQSSLRLLLLLRPRLLFLAMNFLL